MRRLANFRFSCSSNQLCLQVVTDIRKKTWVHYPENEIAGKAGHLSQALCLKLKVQVCQEREKILVLDLLVVIFPVGQGTK